MEKLKYERPFLKKMSAGMMDKSGTQQSEFTPVTHIDEVSVKQLIADYGSPVFVMSERKIRYNYQSAVRAFTTRYPKVQFAWKRFVQCWRYLFGFCFLGWAYFFG